MFLSCKKYLVNHAMLVLNMKYIPCTREIEDIMKIISACRIDNNYLNFNSLEFQMLRLRHLRNKAARPEAQGVKVAAR